MTTIRIERPARTARAARLFSALAIFAAAGLSGCVGHGVHTSAHLEQAQEKLSAMKAAVEWQMAQQQFLAGDLKKAERTIEKSLALNDKVAKSHVLKGRIFMEKGDLETARACFAKAIEVDDKHADAHYYLGFVSERFSQFAEAFDSYEKAAGLEGANPQYVVAAAEMLVKMGQLDRAGSYLADASKRFAHNSAIRQAQGQVEMLRGNPAAAADALSEARLLAPDDLRVLEDLVSAQVAAKRFNDADVNLEVLTRGEGYKDRRDLKLLKARVQVLMGRLPEARAILVSLTSDEEGLRDVKAWTQLGLISAQLNDVNRLRQASARVVALAPDQAESHMLRAQYFRMNREPQKALVSLVRALEIRPGDISAMLIKAAAESDLGRTQDARATLAQVLKTEPANATARQLLAVVEAGGGTVTASVPE